MVVIVHNLLLRKDCFAVLKQRVNAALEKMNVPEFIHFEMLKACSTEEYEEYILSSKWESQHAYEAWSTYDSFVPEGEVGSLFIVSKRSAVFELIDSSQPDFSLHQLLNA